MAKSVSLSNTAPWAEMFLSSLSQYFSLKEAAKKTEQNCHVKKLTSNLLPMLSVMALILCSVCGRASCIITEVLFMICLRSLCRNSGNKYYSTIQIHNKEMDPVLNSLDSICEMWNSNR